MKESSEPISEEPEAAKNSLAPRLSFTENFSRWLRRQHILGAEGKDKEEEEDTTPSGRLSRILRRIGIFGSKPSPAYKSGSSDKAQAADHVPQFLDKTSESSGLSPYLLDASEPGLASHTQTEVKSTSSSKFKEADPTTPRSPEHQQSRRETLKPSSLIDTLSETETPLELPVVHQESSNSSTRSDAIKNPSVPDKEIQEIDLKSTESPTRNNQVIELRSNRHSNNVIATDTEQSIAHNSRRSSIETTLPTNLLPETLAGRQDRAVELAALGLVTVGMETVGRRRADRKIRKDLISVHKNVKQNESRTKQLEQIINKPAESIQRPEVWKQAFEPQPSIRQHQSPERVTSARAISEKQPTQTKEKSAEIKPEKQPSPRLESLPRREILTARPEIAGIPDKASSLETLLHARELLKKPEVVLQRVEQAVEKNVAIERLYERRHEVKDEPQATMVASTAASSPTATSPALSNPTSQSQDAPKVYANAYHQLSANSTSYQTQPYRQAVRNGFLGAAVLLVALLLMTMFS